MKNVVMLSGVLNDNRLITPEMCLRDCLHDIQEGQIDCNKLLVIPLRVEDGFYKPSFYVSNMTCSEIVALCAVMQNKMAAYVNGNGGL